MRVRQTRSLLGARGTGSKIIRLRINQHLVVKVGEESVNLGRVFEIQADRVSLRQSPPSGTRFRRNGELLYAKSFAIWPQPGLQLVLRVGDRPLLGLQAEPIGSSAAKITITHFS